MQCRRRLALLLVLAAVAGILSLISVITWTQSYRYSGSLFAASAMEAGGAGDRAGASRRRLAGSKSQVIEEVDAEKKAGDLYSLHRSAWNSTKNIADLHGSHDAGILDGGGSADIAAQHTRLTERRNHGIGSMDNGELRDPHFNSRLLRRKMGEVRFQKSSLLASQGSRGADAVAKSEQCQPQRNLVFWKTHKCGSSTVQNIVFRYAENNNLRLLLPARTHLFDLVRKFNASKDVPREFLQSARPFNVFAHHARFSAADVATLMPRNSYYVTILRSPITLFESVYDYLELPRAFGNDTHPLKIRSFLKDPHKYYNSSDQNVHRRYAHNPLLYDLGLEPEDMSDSVKVSDAILEVDVRFHLVMIMEYFDESLILLKELMCWSFDDIAYMKLNAREKRRRITKYTQNLVQKWNYGDLKLYLYFNHTLWARIRRYGEERMRRDVAKLQEVNARLMARCLQERTSADDLQDQESIWHPEGIDIVRYHLREAAMNDRTCRNLVKPEKVFTDDIRERQGDYYFPKSKKDKRLWTIREEPDKNAKNVLSTMVERMKIIERHRAR